MRYIWKRCFAALLSVALVFVLLPGTARAADFPESLEGAGNAGNPYQISTVGELKAFRDYVNAGNTCEGQYFKLTEDIDLGDEEWVPIGNNSTYFKGVFDGAEHTVSGLHIVNTVSYAKVGMFWYLGGTIKNLGVSGSVTGRNGQVGGIVGQNLEGTIENCHFTGTVNATEGGGSCQVGGIVGLNNVTIRNCYFSGTAECNVAAVGGIAGQNQGTIENCYNTGTVTSNYRTGGIAGSNIGDDSTCSVKNCYNTGKVSGGTAGGIVGYFSNNTTIENCYYLDSTADKGIGSGNSGGAKAKPADEFRTLAETLNNEYPTLGNPWENDTLLGRPVLKDNKETYTATEDHPFEIPDKTTLENFRNYVNEYNNCEGMYFKLTQDIDLKGNDNDQWEPIGSSSHEFQGTFDGGNFTVSGLYINNSENNVNYQGLFGYIEEGGKVKNLTVDGSVSCFMVGAGIVGMNYGGTVENCHNRCDVSSTSSSGNCGGIVGVNYSGTVTGCYNTGEIHGDVAGGITGVNNNITVTNCYNTGEIHGDDAGGITGLNYNSTIANCYNAGAVTGTDEYSQIGGIVGGENSGTVKDCYNVGEVSFDMDSEASAIGGIVGNKHDEATVANCYYLDTVTSGVGYGDSTGTTAKTEAEFNSGEVAWLLQEGQEEQNHHVWGQTVGDGYPELTDNIDKAVYKITGEVEDQKSIVWYSNNKATLPADPVKAGFTFEGWSTTKSGPVNFEKDSPVNADMTVYAVFTQLQPGTGSVKMENYTCGDKSVEPVAESETNGIENVTYTYTKRGEENPLPDKPTTAGEYTVRAVFPAANGYDEVTATADFRITHKVPSSVNDEVKCGCNSELRLEAEALTEVPSELRNDYTDVAELTRVLAEQVDTGANYAVYDVKIEVKEGTGDWHNAPADSLPGSVTVTLPYPNGTNSSYTFTVVHMFASGDNAGHTETPEVTKGADGLTVTLTGLSPVCVGWTAPSSGFPGFYPTYFSVTVPSDCEGGSVTADSASTIQGSRVTLTVTPDEGYHFGSLTVTDRNGTPVAVTDNGDGTYTFTMPYGKVTVKAAFVKCGSLSFADLDVGAWYHDYTDYVINHGLMRGTGGLFEPGGTVTRAQMVTVLWNMRGKPVVNYYMTYSDVSEGVWYSEAVRWATSEGIAKGYGNGKFGPNDPISREQMAAMMYRYEQKYGDGGFTGDWMYRLPFTDLDRISDWAFEAVAWCNMRGVITGKGNGVFDPKGPAKRGELAAILTRYCGEDDTE